MRRMTIKYQQRPSIFLNIKRASSYTGVHCPREKVILTQEVHFRAEALPDAVTVCSNLLTLLNICTWHLTYFIEHGYEGYTQVCY